jgi:hypothetical protein
MKRSLSASSQSVKEIKIVVMTDHFLYLPLYYAWHRSFFGFIPQSYSISIDPSTDQTDVSAFQMLMDVTSEDNREVDFSVGDPACILDHKPGTGPAPVILAELISNTAFWAVDRRLHSISFIKDLAEFDRIIAFYPGTTSFGIASRIYREAGKPLSIKRVKPGDELTALKASAKNTIALSPDILGIVQLVSKNSQYNIDFALGITSEYHSVLLTALMTRTDVIAQHPELVLGLLKSLQQSLLLIRQLTPDVIGYANERFLGYGEEHVLGALQTADECHVFPTNIEVIEAHWLNAARVACDAKGTPWDVNAQTTAKRIYQQAIQPYGHIGKSAVAAIYSRVGVALEVETPKKSLFRELLGPLSWLTISAAATKWLHWSSPIALFIAVIAALGIARLANFTYPSWGWFLNWVVVISIFVLFEGWQTFGWSWQVVLGIVATLFATELGLIHAESNKK